MRIRNKVTGRYTFYDYDLPYEDDEDICVDGVPLRGGRSCGDAKREHDYMVNVLERTKIIRVYDGEGNLVEERIDESVQRQIDGLNADYAKAIQKNDKRRLILAKRESRK